MERKSRIAALGCGLAFAAICSLNAIAQQAESKTPYDEKWLKQTADELNKSLPKIADPGIRWDSVTPGPGIKLNYSYTLMNQPAGQVDIEQFNAKTQSRLRTAVCTRPGMLELVKNGVTLAYIYRGSDGRFVSQIEVVRQQCG